jgi:serine/threonine protein kinase/tetratricopeptide (TPR) repeat protein
MNAARPDNEEIFHAARDIPDQDSRREYVRAACGGDENRIAHVEALLAAADAPDSLLDLPAGGDPVAAADQPTAEFTAERPGTSIGPYKLIEQIGEGGMGTVWMAQQQEPVKRLVAVKLVKPGMDSREVLARFKAERQALAVMDHPHIARVLDGGTTSAGRPYFVMDLVKGVPITRYCDEHHLTPRQRLELFVPVCQAVQHAHQKGIIHRDLKPSNVLVALSDGRPVPKIIDFGLAKAAGQHLTETTLVTDVGTVVGTLEYMSPEQAELHQLDIDTRSDIYSLGVLVYELLTGSPPFSRRELERAGVLEMLRVIREQEPAKPSARLSTAEGLPTLAANRGTEPKRLAALVRGELDWIVMKALEKDRNRRYETANGFAMDVQRYLADEPVLACPPSPAYRFKKFVRRNRGPVLGTGLVFLALVVGMIGTTWGLIQADKERKDAVLARLAETERAEEAQKRLAQVERGAEIMASVFRDVDPKAEAKEGVTLRVLLGRRLAEAAQQLEGEAVGDPLVVARLQHLLGCSLGELGHPEQAEDVLVRAMQTRERFLGADDPDTVTTQHNLALVYWQRSKYAQAEALGKKVIEVRVTQLGPDHLDTLSAKNNLGLVYLSQKKLTLAEPLFKEVVEGRTARLGAGAPETIISKNNLAGVYRKMGDDAQAETLLNEVVAAATKLRPKHPDTLTYKNNLAEFYASQKKYAQAEELLAEVVTGQATQLGPAHRNTLLAKHNLASIYARQGKYAQAEALLQAVLDAEIATLEVDHPNTLLCKKNLAFVYRAQEKYAQAEPLFRALVTAYTARLGADDRETLLAKSSLAGVYTKLGRDAEAEPLLKEAVDGAKARLQLGNRNTQDSIDALADLHERRGKPGASESNLRDLAEHVRKTAGGEAPAYATRLGQLARNLLLQGKYTQAEPLLRECLAIRRGKQSAAWETFRMQSLLGAALLGQQKYAEAEQQLVQSYQGMKEGEKSQEHASLSPQDKRHRTEALEWLVQLYEATNKPEETAKWRKELETNTKATDKVAAPNSK